MIGFASECPLRELERWRGGFAGHLNGSYSIPTDGSRTYAQQWGLDFVGNWDGFKQDDDGAGTWDLEQVRGHNKVNEITSITQGQGQPAWVTPTPGSDAGGHDAVPQAAGFAAEYAGR